jgi:ParB/RepB/Spo0J family partition protein
MAEINASNATLTDIPVDRIVRNPENPRIIFRPKELDDLLKSIKRRGVQVPISVYKDGNKYVLIDGERRWKCSLKLNRKTIPALIQDRPDPLSNLLLMFNIHSLREQWDLLTIAVKLPRIIDLLEEQSGKRPTEAELSDHTSLPRSVIRRSRLLMDLPRTYIDDILLELKKPKSEQKLTEDFFIEMERGLKTVQRALPGMIDHKDRIRRVLIDKYKHQVFTNRTDFRFLGKIARAFTVPQAKRERTLARIFQRNDYSIARGFQDSVADIYLEKDLISRISSLAEKIRQLSGSELDDDLRQHLRELHEVVREVLSHQ